MPNWLRNMVSWTLPAHQKGVKGQTLAAQGRQGGTETRWVRVWFCVTTGQKLRKVPSRSFFHGMDEALSAIKVLQHGLTPPLNPKGFTIRRVLWTKENTWKWLSSQSNSMLASFQTEPSDRASRLYIAHFNSKLKWACTCFKCWSHHLGCTGTFIISTGI